MSHHYSCQPCTQPFIHKIPETLAKRPVSRGTEGTVSTITQLTRL